MAFNFHKFKGGLIQNGLAESTFNDHYEKWIADYGNSEQSTKDFFWNTYNTLLQTTTGDLSAINPHEMFNKLKATYWEMRMFLHYDGKDPTAPIKAAMRAELEQLNLFDLKMNVSIIGGNRCEYAKQINGKTFPLEVMLEQSVLPYEKCNRDGGCNCLYAGVPVRDKKGKLVRKDD